jgi:hypothetical protein
MPDNFECYKVMNNLNLNYINKSVIILLKYVNLL